MTEKDRAELHVPDDQSTLDVLYAKALAKIEAGRTDTERLDWLTAIYDRHTSKAIPYIVCGKSEAVIWDQANGLTIMGRGATLRAAIDAAMEADRAQQA